jgi:hypothetical protein
MKNALVLLVVMLAIIACDPVGNNNPTDTLSLEQNSVSMKTGDSWLYKRTFSFDNIYEKMKVPDSVTMYSYFFAVKDTFMNDKSYLIIEGKDYDTQEDSIITTKKRVAIHLGVNGIEMMDFELENYYMTGVLKMRASQSRLTRQNYGTYFLKNLALQKMTASPKYDPDVYADCVYPIVFPLVKDTVYTYRDSLDPSGNLPYYRKFIGIESVTVPVGTFDSYKIEWLVKKSLGINGVTGYDWIGNNGLLRRHLAIDSVAINDVQGENEGMYRMNDITELVGKRDINPDTLTPWGKQRYSRGVLDLNY